MWRSTRRATFGLPTISSRTRSVSWKLVRKGRCCVASAVTARRLDSSTLTRAFDGRPGRRHLGHRMGEQPRAGIHTGRRIPGRVWERRVRRRTILPRRRHRLPRLHHLRRRQRATPEPGQSARDEWPHREVAAISAPQGLSASYAGSFGSWGSGSGKLLAPSDVAVDERGTCGSPIRGTSVWRSSM